MELAELQQLKARSDDRLGVVEELNRHPRPRAVGELKPAAGMRRK
jgi:hypothetical protein